jgi:hypothetical protein
MTDQTDRHVERAVAETRGFVNERPAPDVTALVMGRIVELGLRPAPLGALHRIVNVIWAPRRFELRWRPAYAIAAAAALILLIVFLPYGRRTPAAPPISPVAVGDTGPRLFVQFRLDAPNATDVRLAGSFTNWQPRYELHEASPGVWTITLPLAAGVHDYVFVVDGQRWIADPYAEKVDDGFGGVNSRIALVAPDAPRL